MCGSQTLQGTSFSISPNVAAGSASGWLTVTNESSEPCKVDAQYTNLQLDSMDGSIYEASYFPTLKPAPVDFVLAPGMAGTAELRWRTTGACMAVIQGASVTTLPEDEPIRTPGTTPSGKPESSSLCGGGNVWVSGFVVHV